MQKKRQRNFFSVSHSHPVCTSSKKSNLYKPRAKKTHSTTYLVVFSSLLVRVRRFAHKWQLVIGIGDATATSSTHTHVAPVVHSLIHRFQSFRDSVSEQRFIHAEMSRKNAFSMSSQQKKHTRHATDLNEQ